MTNKRRCEVVARQAGASHTSR